MSWSGSSVQFSRTGHGLLAGGTGGVPECTIQIIGSKEIIAATSLQAKRTVNTFQQSASAPLLATIDCFPVTDPPQVTFTGGLGFADFAANFTGT
jgi:hypothetical protein